MNLPKKRFTLAIFILFESFSQPRSQRIIEQTRNLLYIKPKLWFNNNYLTKRK